MEWENGALGPLLVPDVITPDQYYDSRRDDSALRPVKRLMLALLEDALRCFQNNSDAKGGLRKRLFSEAEEWLCKEGGEGPFSFETVCETLGIEPKFLRGGLLDWRRSATGRFLSEASGAPIAGRASRQDQCSRATAQPAHVSSGLIPNRSRVRTAFTTHRKERKAASVPSGTPRRFVYLQAHNKRAVARTITMVRDDGPRARIRSNLVHGGSLARLRLSRGDSRRRRRDVSLGLSGSPRLARVDVGLLHLQLLDDVRIALTVSFQVVNSRTFDFKVEVPDFAPC